jgi:hypothetical protein
MRSEHTCSTECTQLQAPRQQAQTAVVCPGRVQGCAAADRATEAGPPALHSTQRIEWNRLYSQYSYEPPHNSVGTVTLIPSRSPFGSAALKSASVSPLPAGPPASASARLTSAEMASSVRLLPANWRNMIARSSALTMPVAWQARAVVAVCLCVCVCVCE